MPRREPLLVKLFFAGRLGHAALRGLLEAELAAVDAELAGYRQVSTSIHADRGTDDEATLVGPLITLTTAFNSESRSAHGCGDCCGVRQRAR